MQQAMRQQAEMQQQPVESNLHNQDVAEPGLIDEVDPVIEEIPI